MVAVLEMTLIWKTFRKSIWTSNCVHKCVAPKKRLFEELFLGNPLSALSQWQFAFPFSSRLSRKIRALPSPHALHNRSPVCILPKGHSIQAVNSDSPSRASPLGMLCWHSRALLGKKIWSSSSLWQCLTTLCPPQSSLPPSFTLGMAARGQVSSGIF